MTQTDPLKNGRLVSEQRLVAFGGRLKLQGRDAFLHFPHDLMHNQYVQLLEKGIPFQQLFKVFVRDGTERRLLQGFQVILTGLTVDETFVCRYEIVFRMKSVRRFFPREALIVFPNESFFNEKEPSTVLARSDQHVVFRKVFPNNNFLKLFDDFRR